MTDESIVEETEEAQEPLDLDSLSDRKLGERAEKPNLNGETILIPKVELVPTGKVKTAQTGTARIENILFRVYYNDESVWENYGGVGRFVNKDGSTSEPSIDPNGKNAAAKLLRLWLEFTGKKVEEISIKDFFKGLIGLKARITNDKTTQTVYGGETFEKNIITEFVK